MIFSIRTRMLVNILQLSIPLCLFAWLLVQEVQKQIDFTMQENRGVILQAPLTDLLQATHAHKSAVLSGDASQSNVNAQLKAYIEKANATFQQVGSAIGFADQPLTDADKAKFPFALKAADWSAAFQETLAVAATVSAENNAANLELHNKLAAAIKTLITRASDGSNLTLDPDLDSYYVMDAVSFAIPNAIDTLGKAEEDMLQMVAATRASVTTEQSNMLAVWEDTIGSDDAGRIVGSIGTALSEDANFYGASPSLQRLSGFASDYHGKQAAILQLIERVQQGDASVAAAAVTEAFRAANAALTTLGDAARQEMGILLQARIDYFKAHMQRLLAQGGAALLVGLILFWLISRSIVVPIKRLESVMKRIADGDVKITVPYTKKRDEIGHMARTVATFQQNAAAIQGMAKEFESSVKQVVETVSSAATEMHTASDDLMRVSGDGHQKTKELSGDITSVATNMQMIATAGEQLYSAINSISDQVQKTTATTDQAVSEAVNVKQKAGVLLNTTQHINGIVGIINGIAAKITLLALNATIEAARAGEVGKGFAVVAGEVKALAAQTATATAEISTLIESIQSSSKETAEAIDSITTIIDSLNQIAGIVATAVEEQGVVTKDISSHITQATKRMEAVNQNVSVVTSASSHSATAATQTLQASDALSKQAGMLRDKVDEFMKKLVAA